MMIMMPRLQAEESLSRKSDAVFPNLKDRARDRVIQSLERQAGIRPATRHIDPAELAGMGMGVRYKKRPESASPGPEGPETPPDSGRAPDGRLGERS